MVLPVYKFENDEQLSNILKGKHGLQGKDDKNDVTLSINSFMTIWLLTLPDEFKEWSDIYITTGNTNSYPSTKLINYIEIPLFSGFEMGDSSNCALHAQKEGYDYLPKS